MQQNQNHLKRRCFSYIINLHCFLYILSAFCAMTTHYIDQRIHSEILLNTGFGLKQPEVLSVRNCTHG